MVIKYGMAVSMTEFMIRFSGSKNTQFFLRLVYYPHWQYWQNFGQATGWREGIIIDPNHYYGHIKWYSSLHDRIYDPIPWFQKYSVFPPARVLRPFSNTSKISDGPRGGVTELLLIRIINMVI